MYDIIYAIIGKTQLGQLWRIALVLSVYKNYTDPDSLNLGFVLVLFVIILDCLIIDIKNKD